MANTESDVRTIVVGAIQSIASNLGYDAANGNIHAYLFDREIETEKVSYLSALVSSKNRIRAHGVEVIAWEDYSAVLEIPTRQYEITISGYYGDHGSTPVNTIIDHFLLIRDAINDLTLRLSGSVDRVYQVGPLNITRQSIQDVPVEVFIGTIKYRADKYNPAWS